MTNTAIASFFDFVYRRIPFLATVTEPFYTFLKKGNSSLPAIVLRLYTRSSFAILAGSFSSNAWNRVSGAGISARWAPCSLFFALSACFDVFPAKSCPGCTRCIDSCPMNAFDESGRVAPSECTYCMD
ncbi:MAG: hypothetical protein MZV63_30775 [Marinilabiliales bacterium]|nr:hypothetical protein [Marinilabiliales bacterium]